MKLSLISLVSLVAAGLCGTAAVGCSAAPIMTPTRIAEAQSSQGSDATPPTGRATTLAAAISGQAAGEEPKADEPAPLPSTCGAEGTFKDTKLCMLERAYAKKLCGGVYPEVALGLFGKGTPFSRVYLAGDVEAWNASGGRTHRTKLAFDEEVLVLGKNGAGASGGIVMTGAQASFDVLRWDGSCVSVMEGELTARKPPAPKPADVSFSRLEPSTRSALLASPKVKATHEALSKACSSVSSTSATAADKKACEKADRAFSLAIVDAVRAGAAALPAPTRRP